MIYLIDDTPVQMLDEYLKLSDYADILKREEEFTSDDILSLTWASCVLIHSSFHDAKVKRDILSFVGYGDTAPVVQFSDGDSPEAEFSGDNYISSIKKRVFYSRLKKFLDEHPDIANMVKTDEGNYYCFPFLRGDSYENNTLLYTEGWVYRTDLLAKAGVEAIPETPDELYDALVNVILSMESYIERDSDGNYVISNPVNEEENFADKWPMHPKRKENFFKWLVQLKKDLRSLQSTTGMDLQRTLSNSFGQEATMRSFTDFTANKHNEFKSNVTRISETGVLGTIGKNLNASNTFYGKS